MARNDVLPFASAHGQLTKPLQLPVGVGTTAGSWQVGELCLVDPAAGDVNVATVTTDFPIGPAAAANQVAIALADSARLQSFYGTGADGQADLRLAPFAPFKSKDQFITDNVFAAASDTNIGPAGAGVFIGVRVGARRSAGDVTGFVLGSTGGRIARILDANLIDIGEPQAGAAAFVVIEVD